MLIQAGMLVSRVQKIALAQVKGAPDRLNVQVRAGTALLNKVLPDLQRSEVTGEDGGPIEIITRAE